MSYETASALIEVKLLRNAYNTDCVEVPPKFEEFLKGLSLDEKHGFYEWLQLQESIEDIIEVVEDSFDL